MRGHSVVDLMRWGVRSGLLSAFALLLTLGFSVEASGAPKQGTVIVQSNPNEGGSTSGSGTYRVKQTITISAHPFTNWVFTNWNDGVTSASRQFTVLPGTTTFIASFLTNAPPPPPQYGTINLAAEPINGGAMSGSGTYQVGQTVTITATAAPNWGFTRWQDGNVNFSRNVQVPAGTVLYTATFITNPPPYGNINASASPPQGGIVNGGGSYVVGTVVTISASPYTNWRFNNWSDGVSIAQRNVTVPNGTLNLIAYFQNYGTITLTAEPPYGGTVAGGGTYVTGQTVTISATPASTNWLFSRWQDNNTNSSRTITVPSGAMQMTATFITNTVPTFHNQLLYWTPPNSTGVTGYMVSYGAAPKTYTNSVVTSGTNAVIGPLADNVVYYASVQAMGAGGLNSVPSCEISWQAPGSGFCQ